MYLIWFDGLVEISEVQNRMEPIPAFIKDVCLPSSSSTTPAVVKLPVHHWFIIGLHMHSYLHIWPVFNPHITCQKEKETAFAINHREYSHWWINHRPKYLSDISSANFTCRQWFSMGVESAWASDIYNISPFHFWNMFLESMVGTFPNMRMCTVWKKLSVKTGIKQYLSLWGISGWYAPISFNTLILMALSLPGR